MAHEFNIFDHTPLLVSRQESVKRNDKQASLDTSNRALISSGGPSFYVVIASGMSPVHGLLLSETYRVCWKGRECSLVSEYLLFTYSPTSRGTFRRLGCLAVANLATMNGWREDYLMSIAS